MNAISIKNDNLFFQDYRKLCFVAEGLKKVDKYEQRAYMLYLFADEKNIYGCDRKSLHVTPNYSIVTEKTILESGYWKVISKTAKSIILEKLEIDDGYPSLGSIMRDYSGNFRKNYSMNSKRYNRDIGAITGYMMKHSNNIDACYDWELVKLACPKGLDSVSIYLHPEYVYPAILVQAYGTAYIMPMEV